MTGSIIEKQSTSTRFNKMKWYSFGLLVCIAVTLGLDYIESRFQQSSFYLSESFLFSSFWWLFLPIMHLQYFLLKKTRSVLHIFLLIIGSVVAHQCFYPSLVWLISAMFYPHTFSYWQTFQYGFNEYLMIDLMICTFTVMYFVKNRFRPLPANIHHPDSKILIKENDTLQTIWITEGYKKIPIQVFDILYFSASSPYVHLHLSERKFLYNETLKALLGKLDSRYFIRIHKSFIVNINMVQSCQSRLNGDYDLTLANGVVLRLSRNYAKEFKACWTSSHHVTM